MKIGCSSYKLSKRPILKALFGKCPTFLNLNFFQKKYDLYLSWGYNLYGKKSIALAKKYNKPVMFLEDGFLRSPFVSSISKEPYSLVKDTKAPYYDYAVCTDLETLICQKKMTQRDYDISHQAIDYFVHHKLGKFSITTDTPSYVPDGFTKNSLLLIDQVAGDSSLHYGGVDQHTPLQAFDYLKKQFPDQQIYLKLHPEVLKGTKQGCFDFAHNDPNVTCITECDLPSLFAYQPKVFVLTSLSGFEGLLYQCPVTTFGLPWYAAYGLTQDQHPYANTLKNRRMPVNIATIFYAAYIDYTHYVDPVTLKKTSVFATMQLFARIKRHIYLMQGHIIAVGIRPWKKHDFYPWIKTPFNQVTYYQTYQKLVNLLDANPQTPFKIVVWGYKFPKTMEKITKNYPHIQIIRVEDGFIRSYGLGSDFIPPLSLSFDTKDLHYYKTVNRHSDFYQSVSRAPFPAECQERAEKLRTYMVTNRISKYNIEKPSIINVPPHQKHIIFVPGQVSGDASLKYGGLAEHIQNDHDLLKQVRQEYPDSYILYKPHPDVTKGNRKKHIQDHACDQFYNQKVTDASIIDCIKSCDMVATMTSQVGFDALIHDKKVQCYGHSFYKNYGFCHNDHRQDNHTTLSLSDFIYASLIDYPIYRYNNHFISAETAIDIILKQKNGQLDFFRRFVIASKILRYLYKLKKWTTAIFYTKS